MAIDKRMICHIMTFFILFILICGSAYAEKTDKEIALETTQISSRVSDALWTIQSLLPDNVQKSDEKYIIYEELIKDSDKIKTRKGELEVYLQANDSEGIRQNTQTIIYLSNKIYAYECLFRLEYLVRESQNQIINYKMRVKDIPTPNITALIKQKDRFIKDGFTIRLDELYAFSNYEDYYGACTQLNDNLVKEYRVLMENYNPFELGGWGYCLLTITITFIVWLGSFALFNIAFVKWSKEKIQLLMKIIITALGIPWGLFFIQSESLIWRSIWGGIIGFVSYFIIYKFLTFVKHSIFNINKDGPSIRSLKIGSDYEHVLEKAGVETVTELLEANLKDLSDTSGLQIETLIRIREKSKRLKSQQKSRRKKK